MTTIRDFITTSCGNVEFIDVRKENYESDWDSFYFSSLDDFEKSPQSNFLDFCVENDCINCVYDFEFKTVFIYIRYPDEYRVHYNEFDFLLPWS